MSSPTVLTAVSVGGGQAAQDGAQPVSVTTGPLVAIPRLTDAHFTITPINPQFTQIASSTLGNVGEATDGFDLLFNLSAAGIDDEAASVDELLQHLVDADFLEGEFEAAAWTPIGNAIGPFTDNGDNIVQAFNDSVTPPDNSGGGGGGGQGGGGGGQGGGGGGHGGGGGGNGDGGGGGSTGDPGTVRCHLVVARDGSSQYVCEQTGGGGGGHHGPLQE